MIKIVTVVGARPQFVKAAALSDQFQRNFSNEIEEKLVHTGQHFDRRMSSLFFEELGLPEPSVTLPSFSGDHGFSTGNMLVETERALKSLNPDLVLVYGDTNSTLAGALAAVKLAIPVAHVEAGLRSDNRRMPEEVNRMLTDRISAINFAPSERAMKQLRLEGLGDSARHVGDIMFDAVKLFSNPRLHLKSRVETKSKLQVLVTIHRQENTDQEPRLKDIITAITTLGPDFELTLPLHPRLKRALDNFGLSDLVQGKINVVEPLSFLEMLRVLQNADLVITDSGGLQKEAFYLGVQCITLRGETEWPETIQLGWNRLWEPGQHELAELARGVVGKRGLAGFPYGDGESSRRIAQEICNLDWKIYF